MTRPGMTDLKPWTQVIAPNEALLLLDLAEPGISREEWEEKAKAALPQAIGKRRQEIIRRTRVFLLDLDADRIRTSAFLRLLRGGSPRLRKDLFWARYCFTSPWPRLAASEVVRPAIAEATQPLAAPMAGVITTAAWREFVLRRVLAGTAEPSIKKTVAEIGRAFNGLGCLDMSRPRRGCSTAHPGDPDPLAFAWLLRFQLENEQRREATDDWAATQSVAAILFAVDEAHGRTLVEGAPSTGLFERSFLMGSGRLRLSGGE